MGDLGMLKIIHEDAVYGSRLITTQSFRCGDLIRRIEEFRIVDRPTYQTVQIDRHSHINGIRELEYMNHSCRPSAIIDTKTMVLIAAEDITEGDEITFFYPSTEWEMDRPFKCLCSAPDCLGVIAGAKYIHADIFERYFFNAHILELAGKDKARAVNSRL